jgi:hypothetical protein
MNIVSIFSLIIFKSCWVGLVAFRNLCCSFLFFLLWPNCFQIILNECVSKFLTKYKKMKRNLNLLCPNHKYHNLNRWYYSLTLFCARSLNLSYTKHGEYIFFFSALTYHFLVNYQPWQGWCLSRAGLSRDSNTVSPGIRV